MIMLLFAMFGLAAVFAIARIVRPGVLVDRVTGFDAMLWSLVCMIALHAAATGDTTSADIPLVIALLGVLGTVTAAVWLERRGGGTQ